MAKKYIILAGSDGGFGNLGDEFILDAQRKFYKSYQKKFNIIILKHVLEPAPPEDGYKYVYDYEKDFEALGLDIADIALVHYYGGGYLNTYWYEDKVWLYRRLVKKGLPVKKIVFTGQGLGPFKKDQQKELTEISRIVPIFGVRDIDSTQQFPHSEFGFDDTISLINPKAAKKLRKKTIAVNLRPAAEYVAMDEEYMVSVLKSIEKFAKENKLSMFFFNMVSNPNYDEKKLQLGLIQKAGIKDYVMHDRPKDYKELLTQLSRSRLVITTSYHGTLASIYKKVPVISLYQNEYYKLKFEGLKNSVDTQLLKPVNAESFTDADLKEMLATLSPTNIKHAKKTLKTLHEKNEAQYAKIRLHLDKQ